MSDEHSTAESATGWARPRGTRQPRWHDYTAFVLSGGGARGALQVGALRALMEAGETPDVIVGTSAGAFNGAVLARTPTLAGIDVLTLAWNSASTGMVLLNRDVSFSSTAQAMAGLLLFSAARRVTAGRASLYSDAGLRQLIDTYFGDHTFEELQIPLYIVATDLTHGDRAVFEHGPVPPTVLASSAIPGIFPPVAIDGALYVDGGALDNIGLDVAVHHGARRLWVLDVGYDESNEEVDSPSDKIEMDKQKGFNHSSSLASVLELTVQAMAHYHLERALRRVPRGIEVHVLRLATNSGGGALDFGNTTAWLQQGYDAARSYLAQLPRMPAIQAATARP